VLVSALDPRADQRAAAMVLAKGDATAGGILLLWSYQKGTIRASSSAESVPAETPALIAPAPANSPMNRGHRLLAKAPRFRFRICGWSNWISQTPNASPLKR
jgi:hypothetical protein